MVFTKEEFHIMVDELLYQETVSFDMLCLMAEKTLKPTVIHWCQMDDCLRGRGYEDDILQEIYMRLINTTVDYFLLRNGKNGPVNDNPEGFHSWMFKVATNIKRDFANRVRQDDFKTEDFEDLKDSEWAEDEADEADKIECLKQAVNIVLESDASVYKTLTWLAQFVFMLQCDISKIKSNDMIVELFEKKTLNEMYLMIQNAAKKIPWLCIDKLQNKRIEDALNCKWDKDITYGDVEYGTFFMKKGGKKSISDWVNRMNNTIRRAMDNGTSENG